MRRPCRSRLPLLACLLAFAAAPAAHAQTPEPGTPEIVVLPPEDHPLPGDPAYGDPGDDDGAAGDPYADPYEDPAAATPWPPLPVPAPAPPAPSPTDKTSRRAISATPRLSGPTVPGRIAVMRPDGTAIPPASAPVAVKRMIWTANRMIGLRYRWGGGHRSFADSAYDCSGAVSYALRAAQLLDWPLVSGQLAKWGRAGAGRWVTVYANRRHVYMTVAGLRLDTSPVADPGGRSGPRWRPLWRPSKGFHRRHPVGL